MHGEEREGQGFGCDRRCWMLSAYCQLPQVTCLSCQEVRPLWLEPKAHTNRAEKYSPSGVVYSCADDRTHLRVYTWWEGPNRNTRLLHANVNHNELLGAAEMICKRKTHVY